MIGSTGTPTGPMYICDRCSHALDWCTCLAGELAHKASAKRKRRRTKPAKTGQDVSHDPVHRPAVPAAR